MAWLVEPFYEGARALPLGYPDDFEVDAAERLALAEAARLGHKIDPQKLATELFLKSPRKHLSDFTAKVLPIVSLAFKTLIEEWEPERHLFHPVQIRKTRTGPIVAEHYFLNQVASVDTVIPNRGTNADFGLSGRTNQPYFHIPAWPDSRLYVHRSRIRKRHVWFDVRQTKQGLFISDDFEAALKVAGVKHLHRVAYCEEV